MDTAQSEKRISIWRNWPLISVACAGFLAGVFCGYKSDDYKQSLAWDKVGLLQTRQFVEWYAKLCEKVDITAKSSPTGVRPEPTRAITKEDNDYSQQNAPNTHSPSAQGAGGR